MDPNANLEEMLALARTLVDDTRPDSTERLEMGDRLADLVLAMDGWLRGGGFTPDVWLDAWVNARKARG